MPVLTYIIGGSMFGFAARLLQLSIQHRNLFENLGGHAITSGLFGYTGYLAYHWENRVNDMLDIKEAEIREKQKRKEERLRLKRLVEERKSAEEPH